ncbi:hypothetical protein Efla_006479 [Eimeria flavescens]
MVSTLRYLGAVAGASLAGSLPPASCKEHRSSGMEKLRMQQQRDPPHSADVSSLLLHPPRPLGLAKVAEWQAKNMFTSLQLRLKLLKLEKTAGVAAGDSAAAEKAKPKRKKVVVAGGGWASAAFVRQLDPRQFEVVWVSPQPHFSYTPLLPSVCGGSLPVAACTAKLRDLLCTGGDAAAKGTFQQAFVDGVDVQNKKVTCRPAGFPSDSSPCWEEAYDYLVLAVGSDVNTFNIRGVKEHALFLRTAEDAQRIRAKLAACLESAAHPNTTEEARRRLLTFVVVGAGPSGVEAAAEIRDYLNSEGKRLYPHVSHHFRVLLLEMGAAPLPMYNEQVREAAKKTFKDSGIDLRLHTQVTQVNSGSVVVKRSPPPTAAAATHAASAAPPNAPGPSAASAAAGAAAEASIKGGGGLLTPASQVATVETIPTDFVLWASGVRPTVLATTVAKGLAAQSKPHRLLVDPSFRVLGAEGLFALGDCCTVQPPLLTDHADQLFELAVAYKPASAGTDWLLANGERLSTVFPQLHPKRNKLHELSRRNHLNLEDFKKLLEASRTYTQPHAPVTWKPRASAAGAGTLACPAACMHLHGWMHLHANAWMLQEVDKRYRSPAPTAQNARQEGRYLALLFNTYLGPSKASSAAAAAAGEEPAPAATPPAFPAFVEAWRGSLCFLGDGKAALQLPVGTFVGGFPYTLLWRMVYLQLQPTARASWRCCEGWIQSALFGRDIRRQLRGGSKAAQGEWGGETGRKADACDDWEQQQQQQQRQQQQHAHMTNSTRHHPAAAAQSQPLWRQQQTETNSQKENKKLLLGGPLRRAGGPQGGGRAPGGGPLGGPRVATLLGSDPPRAATETRGAAAAKKGSLLPTAAAAKQQQQRQQVQAERQQQQQQQQQQQGVRVSPGELAAAAAWSARQPVCDGCEQRALQLPKKATE